MYVFIYGHMYQNEGTAKGKAFKIKLGQFEYKIYTQIVLI